ncbi:hypothetical protein ACNSOF_21600 (plasmid) [Bacillus subtilis]
MENFNETYKQGLIKKVEQMRKAYRMAAARPDLMSPYHALQELRHWEQILKQYEETHRDA